MKHEFEAPDKKKFKKRMFVEIGAALILALVSYAFYASNHSETAFGVANLLVFAAIIILFFHTLLKPYIKWWQETAWPWFMHIYEKQLRLFLRGRNPWYLLTGVVALLFLTFIATGIRNPKVLFFPDNMPNAISVRVQMPVGTDQKITDSVTKIVEDRVVKVLGKNNPDVESVITNIALQAGDDMDFSRTLSAEKGKVTVNFVEYKNRIGRNTTEYLDLIRHEVKGIPGTEISTDKNRSGPPTGKPVNIEITGENLPDLIADAGAFKNYLDSLQIPGVEDLKSDFQENKPEIAINIDRERANHEGISTGQIALEIRTAVLGKEISKYKIDEDEFPIQLRYSLDTRENINKLINTKITYRDMNSGLLRQIPLSSIATIDYVDSYGGIKRQNLKRIITLSSGVLTGYTANEIVAQIKKLAADYPLHEGVQIKLTGEQEDQAETSAFLGKAMLIAIGLIFFILITQFNSISKTIIILSEVIFSVIGVLLGIVIFNMSISIIMTGLGIVALGGIVVRNGILIVEFIDTLKARGLKTREAIVQAGLTRITPVILTATATILGLVPLAIGFNLNFTTMFTQLNPQIHIGGDNVMFWGPLSWTIIFGLSFATFLTLLFVPAMYIIAYEMKIRLKRRKSNKMIVDKD
jgi:multidrug efflux pump subunit AcrB